MFGVFLKLRSALFAVLILCLVLTTSSCTVATVESSKSSGSQTPTKSSTDEGNLETPSSEKSTSAQTQFLGDLKTNPEIVKTTPCKVTKHTDGDTLSVDCLKTRIRMIGVDTPETVKDGTPVQCYGKEASARTSELLPIGATVYLEIDPSQGEVDKYDRPLRYIYNSSGSNINLELIAEGYAHEYTYSHAYKYQHVFRDAENLAREKGAGLWAPNTCNGDTSKPASSGGSGNNASSSSQTAQNATGSRGHDYYYGSTHCVKIPNDGDWYECTRKNGTTYRHTGS